MATIFDLLEVTDISENTTYSTAAGNLLGVVDGMNSTDLDDGEFDVGDAVVIDGVVYTIDRIQEPLNSSRITLGDGTDRSVDPGSESNLSAVFLTISNGGDIRHFIIPNDSFGDMNVAQFRTGGLNDVGGSDAATISTVDNDVNVVCFLAGTGILTPDGEVAVENLKKNDIVSTHAHGPQRVRAILVRELDLSHGPDRLKPIAIGQGSLGPDRPNRRLCVSPQHRMLVTDGAGNDVLVPAKALLGRKGVRMMRGKRHVAYFHIVFARHEIICANGTLTESFFPGPMALKAVTEDALVELKEIFGDGSKAETLGVSSPAAPMLGVRAAQRALCHVNRGIGPNASMAS